MTHKWDPNRYYHSNKELTERSSFTLVETEIHYQNTQVESRTPSLSQLQAPVPNIWCPSIQRLKPHCLNTNDPRPPPSSLYKIKSWGFATSAVWILWLNGTSQLIRLGLSNHQFSLVRAKMECCKSHSHIGNWVTDCPMTRILSSSITANRCHNWVRGFNLFAEVQSAHSIAPADKVDSELKI